VELFLRLTILIAVALAALFILAFVLKIVFVAAILAGIGLAGLFIYGIIRRAAGKADTLPVRR
jgi:hypothetical protein